MKAVGFIVLGLPLVGCVVGLALDSVGLTPGRGAMPVLFTLAGLVVGLAFCWMVAHKVAKARSVPLWLSDYHPGDGTLRIRFRNHQYAERFLAASLHRDLRMTPPSF
jgi:hypothetical protein